MLRKIRLTLALIFFVCITLMFLDFTGVTRTYFGWMAKIQFLPAVLALNVGVIILLAALTIVFGRIYCSVICPMGVFQDVIGWFGKRFRNKKDRKRPYTFSPAKSVLRYSVLGVFILAIIAGVGSFVALLAPYSSYGRIAANIFQPIYRLGNNVLASIAEHYESYAFYDVDVWIKTIPTFVIAIATAIIIGVLAARNGRTYCNTICPVGSVLGFLSRFSLFRITFDEQKCKKCSMCSRNCKASCIDFKTHTVDYSRCVVCGDCLEKCNFDALHYKFGAPSLALAFPKQSPKAAPKAAAKPAPKATAKPAPAAAAPKADAAQPAPVKDKPQQKVDNSLRLFLTTIATGAAAGLAKAQIIEKATDVKVDGGVAPIVDKVKPVRMTPITPPGSISLRNMKNHCTGCQLCVSACPNNVLRPSTNLMTLMQPEMSYERGYCRPECNKCSQVCPAGAIRPISVEDKSSIQIGHAVWNKEHCIPFTDEQECGNCARHCPVHAIEMVPIDPEAAKAAQEAWDADPRSRFMGGGPKILKYPVVNEALCIGCGSCENLCPARPISAIYVEGHQVHRVI